MSIGSLIKRVGKAIANSPAASSVETFALTEAAKAVAALKTTSIGNAVAGDIKALTDSKLSGAEKFEKVVANTAPLVVTFLTNGGRAAAIDEVEDIVRALVQSVFNDVASTKAVQIGRKILLLLGIK